MLFRINFVNKYPKINCNRLQINNMDEILANRMTIGMENATLHFFTREKTPVTDQIMQRYYPCQNATLCLNFVATNQYVIIIKKRLAIIKVTIRLVIHLIPGISSSVWVTNTTITWNRISKTLLVSTQHVHSSISLHRHHLKWLSKRWAFNGGEEDAT